MVGSPGKQGNLVRSPAAQILETALALQRAPGERFRLRERPLPPDLLYALEVASGSPQALASAAAELGESDATVLDASRFYLEQILFAAPDADAYRILGVTRDAPTDLIRTHHRWLQRWLHPDRAQAGDASVYATRVNQAWATLRTPESRHQYDVRLAEARMAGATAALPASTVRHWEHEEPARSYGRRSRWLLGAALVACSVLAVLIVSHEQGPQPWAPPDGKLVAEEQGAGDQPVMEDRDLGILTDALAAVTTEPTPAPAPAPEPLMVGAAQAATYSHPEPPVAGRTDLESRIPAAATRPAAPIASTALVDVAPPATQPIRPTRQPLPSGAAQAATEQPIAVEVAARQAPPPEPIPPKEPPTLLLDRMHKAEQRVAQLTAYLAAQPGATPLWNDLQTARNAERIRNRIAASHGTALKLASPNWQLQPDNATLNVNYSCGACRVQQGRLDVQLVWREGLWLVRGVGLAPAA